MLRVADHRMGEGLRPQAVPRDHPVPPARFVEPDGSLTSLGEEHGVDTDLAATLHRDMVLARTLDREALALQRQGELLLWLMCWGQEAAQVGSIRALTSADMVFPSYREHAAALCRGITPGQLLTQWRGASHSGWDPAEHRFHVYSLVLGTQTLHAVGFAAGMKLAGDEGIAAVYFGDGAASQGDVNEALNWAAAGRMPILFICQNNQWAISTPVSLQMAAPLHERAAGFGMPAWHVDGNDVLAVHAVTKAAAAHVRSGSGPAFVEAETYRRGGHSSSDDPLRYRSQRELTEWELRDPIERIERLLLASGVPRSHFDALDLEAREFAASVREACVSIADPQLDDLFRTAYSEHHTMADAERGVHSAFLAMLGAED